MSTTEQPAAVALHPAIRGCDQCIIRDHKAIALLQRRINGKATVLDVSQQVGEIALDREHPAMFAKGIDKRGIGAINSRQRRRWLGIQRGVVINEPTDDGRQRAHGSHHGCKQRSEIA